MQQLWPGLKYYLKRLVGIHPKVNKDIQVLVQRYGTDYGGWNILKDSLSSESIVYSIGVGEDISFDMAIINKYDCRVYAFDPTPRVESWLKQQHVSKKFIFKAIGIANKTGSADFYMPANPNYISHSAQPANNQTFKIQLPVCRLQELMLGNQHTSIDLLKIDIEGFEYEVLEDILKSKIFIKQILVEYHHGLYNYTKQQTLDSIELLRNNGYKLFSISHSGREYSFLKTV